jgi:NADPH:quinone reductase
MRAIRLEAFGDPSVLEAVEIPAPIANEKTALIRVLAASINPSDVKNVAGAMSQTTLPRVPGRDFAGVVEAGPSEWIGAEVWGMGGDTGFGPVVVGEHRRCCEALEFQHVERSTT